MKNLGILEVNKSDIKDKYFKLYANCIPVKGANRSIICDLQNHTYIFIPNDLFDILTGEFNKVDQVYDHYGENNSEILDSYFDRMISNNLLMISDSELSDFPDLSLNWDFPSKINNLVIELSNDGTDIEYLELIHRIIEKLSVKSLELRVLGLLNVEVETLLSIFKDSRLSDITLVLNYDNYSDLSISDILKSHIRLTTLIFYNCSINKFDKVYNCSVYNLKTINDINGECGCVNNALFNVNIEFFTESIHFNSCLNRKIAIDRNKNVKNCLSMKYAYGKLSEDMLENLIKSAEFTKFWHINKDKVTICKDCEFRYICHDCRAFTINPNDLFSKPLKCGYDPYTNKWTDWKKIKENFNSIEHYWDELPIQ